jgi:CRISPR-associated protein Csm1
MRRFGEADDDARARAEKYSTLYQALSQQISAQKLTRYRPEVFRQLNAPRDESLPGERECKVCHGVVEKLDSEGRCSLCAALSEAAGPIQDADFALIEPAADGKLPLPFGKSLTFASRTEAAAAAESGATERMYGMNKFYVGEAQGTRLWIGDYWAKRTFGEYVTSDLGIERLGVLRLDVDNLGQAFVAGFTSQESGRFNTLSRTATFSRMMSLFFRQNINYLLEKPKYRPITGADRLDAGPRPRLATVIYAGGDDVFVVGAWADVLEFGLELQAEFTKYTQGKLTVSAGLGVFPDKYPIAEMARQVGDLESAAKNYTPEKNALAVFSSKLVFPWDRLRDDVIGEKYQHIADFFGRETAKGNSFTYRLLGLLDSRDDPITLAHWVYFLTRARADAKDEAGFKAFSDRLYQWFQNEEDARALRLALMLYVYRTRNTKGD